MGQASLGDLQGEDVEAGGYLDERRNTTCSGDQRIVPLLEKQQSWSITASLAMLRLAERRLRFKPLFRPPRVTRNRRKRNSHQITILSTSSRLSSSRRRSWSCVVRVDAWFAIAAAFSSVPPFLR
jgi:hypothetical protein